MNERERYDRELTELELGVLDIMIDEWLAAEEYGKMQYGAYLFNVAVNYFIYVQVRKDW